MSGRLIRSSSLGGSADVLGRYKPVAPQEIRQATRHAYFVPPKAAAAAAAEDPRKCIFTFTSPPRDDDPKSSGRENFLDACGLCKKRIPQNKDTYMYGYQLKAYCSPECRDDQIALDEEFNPPSPSRSHNAAKFLKRNMLKLKFIRS